MKTRQNPLSKVESLIQRIVESPFAFLFPSKLQPAQVLRRLERAMEDFSLLQGEGRRLAPEIYDIYVSFKDHQQLGPVMPTLQRDWTDHLIQFARQHHYTLRSEPVLRLHPSSEVRMGDLRIDAQLFDKQHMSPDEGGMMATRAISAEELERIRQQAASGASNPGAGSGVSLPPTAMPMIPPAWLIIRVPQQMGGQQRYSIAKPVVNIGRQTTNDIIVEDKKVSRYHAQIKFAPDGQFNIYDLGSTNGIIINGVPNQRQHTLHNGDRFTIGSYDFYFERR